MAVSKQPRFRENKTVEILTQDLAGKMMDFRVRLAAMASGYPVLTDWHPSIPEGWGTFPQAPLMRSTVFRPEESGRSYNHHQAICKFGGQFVATWSSGLKHEDYVGQQIHLATSTDCMSWSEPTPVVETPLDSGLVRNNAGLWCDGKRLYSFVGVAQDFGRDKAGPGMSVLKDQQVRLDVYESTDMRSWTLHERVCENIYLFEGPRMTAGGRLLCAGRDLNDSHGILLIWEQKSFPDNPKVIDLPVTPGGVRPGQCTWYQTDDGRVWLFAREYTMSCHLALAWSDDEGDTWSELLPTDFPNTFSRAYAGRFPDGRYFIVGNNYDIFLERRHMLIALSDDGITFDRQYELISGNTTRRIDGRHKEDGYHYPNCCLDGSNLVVIYSVNKEDIEVGVLDTTAID